MLTTAKNQRVAIYQDTPQQNNGLATGLPTQTLIANRWSVVVDLRADTRLIGQRPASGVTHRLVMDFVNELDPAVLVTQNPKPIYWIKYRGRRLNIIGLPVDPVNTRREIILECIESETRVP